MEPNQINNTICCEVQQTQVGYAFYTTGSILCFNSLTFFVVYLSGSKVCCLPKEADEKNEEVRILKDNKCFVVSFVFLVFTVYWTYCTLELTYSNYLTTYAVEELGWSKSTGATLSSVFWASYTFGRVVGIFIIKYISVEILLCSNTVATIISLLPMVFFVHVHDSIMWISTVLTGLFISTIFACGLTFADAYIPLSGGIGSIYGAGCVVGSITSPTIIAPLFDVYGMQIFVVVSFVSAIALFLVFLGACALGRKHGKKIVGNGYDKGNETKALLHPEKDPQYSEAYC